MYSFEERANLRLELATVFMHALIGLNGVERPLAKAKTAIKHADALLDEWERCETLEHNHATKTSRDR